MVNYYEDEEAKSEPVPKRIYMIINDEKHSDLMKYIC